MIIISFLRYTVQNANKYQYSPCNFDFLKYQPCWFYCYHIFYNLISCAHFNFLRALITQSVRANTRKG